MIAGGLVILHASCITVSDDKRRADSDASRPIASRPDASFLKGDASIEDIWDSGRKPAHPPDGGGIHDAGHKTDASQPVDANMPEHDTGMPSEVVCNTGSRCNDKCVDTQTDKANCGTCGHSCAGNTCMDGQCQPLTLASDLYFPNQIAVSDTYVYFTDGGDATISDGSKTIYRLPIDASSLPAAFHTATVSIDRLAFAGGRLFWGQGTDIFATEESAASPVMVTTGADCWTTLGTSVIAVTSSTACTCQNLINAQETIVCTPNKTSRCGSACTCPTDGSIVRGDGSSAATPIYTGHTGVQLRGNCVAATADAVILLSEAATGDSCIRNNDPNDRFEVGSRELVRIPLDAATDPKLLASEAAFTSSDLAAAVLGKYVYYTGNSFRSCYEYRLGVRRTLATGGAVTILDDIMGAGVQSVVEVASTHYLLASYGLLYRLDPPNFDAPVRLPQTVNGIATAKGALYITDKGAGQILKLVP